MQIKLKVKGYVLSYQKWALKQLLKEAAFQTSYLREYFVYKQKNPSSLKNKQIIYSAGRNSTLRN